jgi:hypothetical protein
LQLPVSGASLAFYELVLLLVQVAEIVRVPVDGAANVFAAAAAAAWGSVVLVLRGRQVVEEAVQRLREDLDSLAYAVCDVAERVGGSFRRVSGAGVYFGNLVLLLVQVVKFIGIGLRGLVV